MVSDIQIFNQITALIVKLSPHYRFKLLEFIVEMLKPIYPAETRFISEDVKPTYQIETSEQISGSAFLMSIVGLGESDEADLSERDEEILAQEIDPIRGWGLKENNLP